MAAQEATDFYVLFPNHMQAMELFRFTKERGLHARISPTPRVASVCCGVSLLVSTEEIGAVRQCVSESGVEIEKIVELPRQIDPRRDHYC